MYHYLLKTSAILTALTLFSACQKQAKEMPEYDNISLTDLTGDEIRLTPKSQTKIILAGGNGKYHVGVSDRSIATAEIRRDTLVVDGYRIGTTKAVIFSDEMKKDIEITVRRPSLQFSHPKLKLFPWGGEKFTVASLIGGGDLVQLAVEDPQKCVDVKWDAKSGILELTPFYEGDVTLKATDQNGEQHEMSVEIRCEDGNEKLQNIGVYDNDNRTLSHHINPGLTVEKEGDYICFFDALSTNTRDNKYIKVYLPEVKQLEVGSFMDLKMEIHKHYEKRQADVGGLKNGISPVIVEKVSENNCILRGQGFKVVLPVTDGQQ